MPISADYARPVQVNGFACYNCTDVANAKKHIDPAHPQSGPYDINAAQDPTRSAQATSGSPPTGKAAPTLLSVTGSLRDATA